MQSSASLDMSVIASLLELEEPDSHFFAELVDMFCDDAGRRLIELRAAAEKQDWNAIQAVAHTLKSAGANLGATAFAEACRVLEQDLRDGRLDEVAGRQGEIEQEYHLACESLRALL